MLKNGNQVLEMKKVMMSGTLVSLGLLSYSTRYIYFKMHNFVLENEAII